jgi:dipeptidyl aminopeptidase/acylaminoacyl peptidase
MFLSPFTRQAQAVAQLGYVTVVIDSRGTPGRSKAFHDAAHRNFGGFVDDHATAIRELLDRESFLRSDKAAITGGSWGGYAAFRCLAERPDVYRAAVANAPGFDPFSCVLYECYLGFPQTDRAAYDAAQTLTLAGQVEGDLMIACGTSDHATWTDAVKMADALIRAGKSHEFVVLPGQIHGYESVHDGYYYRKMRDFFADSFARQD